VARAAAGGSGDDEVTITPAGARDLAWVAHRAAQARDDPDLLAAADVWACRAARSGPPDWALEATAAAIHRARGDGAEQARAAISCLAACERAGDGLDLLGGRGGALVAAARVLDGMVDVEADSGPLARWARETVEETWRTVDAWGPVSACPELPHLGMAHGWAGLLYATLCACRSTATPLPGGLGERLGQLAELARPSGRGVRWVGTIPHPAVTARTPTLAPGWCSGSAGHALLWALAHEQLGDRRYLDLAERAGLYAVDHPSASPDYCCGATGRGFALLQLYQATGETSWLAAAERLARAAAAAWPEGADPFSLRRGPLGTALLLIELEAPECAVLPVS
jgi:serine/threonine-protein kinase